MSTDLHSANELRSLFHFKRSRLNRLLNEAIKYPLVVVCAGAGYGKTSAVRDFIEEQHNIVVWVQLSRRDNVGARFWENYVHAIARFNQSFANALVKLGFPDNDDKLSHYYQIIQEYPDLADCTLVFDDFHLVNDPAVVNFIESSVMHLPTGSSIILISRCLPGFNLAGLIGKDLLFVISENDLRFVDTELASYFAQQGLTAPASSLRAILQDTDGWAFAINLIARSFEQAPGYQGYLRNAMKTNIFQLMESEIWNKVSERLQLFLIRLSLIEHLSVDLIDLLAKGDKDLIAELEQQNAYIRLDTYISAYQIHHLFLEFIRQKQSLLSEQDKQQTYEIAAAWCDRNGFKVDALSFYEKAGDYQAIIQVYFALPTQLPEDIARFAIGIFDRAPINAFDEVEFFVVMHIRTLMCLGRWPETSKYLQKYEQKFLQLPESDFKNHTLAGIYYCWGIMRTLMCTVDNSYDFDIYYAKMCECLAISPFEPGRIANHPSGPWISLVGSPDRGAPQAFNAAFIRAAECVSQSLSGAMTGLDDLIQGELLFYQGEARDAESYMVKGLERAREHKQYDTVHRALYYLLRIAISQGNYTKARAALNEMHGLLDEDEYSARFITYDISTAWFYCTLGMPELVPEWLREKFSSYGHVYFIENFGNQAKARYFYMTQNFPTLLAYIDEQKRRESILFGRIEMLVVEACIYYQMKDRSRALAVLHEAYQTASPNSIILPFVGLGKDMRTLTAAALRDPDCAIPREWLEQINRKSASYAKRKAHIISEYKQANGIASEVNLTQRELEIVTDLSHGLSRREIAISHKLSVNTVKMVVSIIYDKLGAENLADLIRICTELRLVQ